MLGHDDAYNLKLTSLPKLDKHIDPDLYELDKSLSTHVKDLSVFKDKGRIIGNIGPMPPKFVKIYEIIGEEPAVVYSNFYEEGILLFEQFLRQKTKTMPSLNPPCRKSPSTTSYNDSRRPNNPEIESKSF
jgi:hypothetical protein